MKKHGVALLVLMLAALAGLATAQNVITAQVPFEFVASGKTMPAGEVRIEVQSGSGQPALWIASGDKHVYALPQTGLVANVSDQTSLVFHRYGDRYFLSSIKREGLATGYALPKSKVEMELQAQGVSQSDVTVSPSAE